MADASDSAGRGSREPIGVGIRLIAFAVDIFLVKFLLLIAVVGLSIAADGRLGLDNPVVAMTTCRPAAPVPEGLRLPADFEPTSARRCTRSLLGLLRDDRLVVSGRANGGEIAHDALSIPVDTAGLPAPALIVDWLAAPALAIYLILLEWRRGTTFAKWFVARLVRTTAGTAIRLGNAVGRSLVRLAVLLGVSASTSFYGPEAAPWRMKLDLTISGLLGQEPWLAVVLQTITFCFLLHLAYAAFARKRPLHDLLSGTKVVREFPA